MADATSSIFNKRATEKLRNPDDLDKYVRVTNPSIWVAICACVALLVGLLAWGVFGTVTTSVAATGVCVKGNVMCFLSVQDAAKVDVGDYATVEGAQMEVASKSAVPLSAGEVEKEVASDYLVSTLVKGDWAYQLALEGDTSSLSEGVPLEVSITIERVAPISLILGGKK